MFKNKLLVTLLSTFFFLMLGMAFLLFFKTEKEDFEGISDIRDKAHAHLSASLRTAVTSEYEEMFKVCADMGLYDHFTSLQPADLSKEELEKAIDLHQRCGTNFSERRMFSYEKMKESVSQIMKELEFFETIDQSQKDDFVYVWGLIDESVNIQTEIFTSFGSIQIDYWEAEYGFRLGEITFEEREERFGELNRKAMRSRELMGSERENIDILRFEEYKIWRSLVK